MSAKAFWRWAAAFYGAIVIFSAAGAENGKELIFLDPICQQGKPKHPPLPPGNPDASTRRMVERLKNLSETSDAMGAAFYSAQTVAALSNLVVVTTNLSQKTGLFYKYGMGLMASGRPDLALNTFADLEEMIQKAGYAPSRETQQQMRFRKAIAFLRLGEQENCVANPNDESCLFPLQPHAYHVLPRGSRGAVKLLEEQLDEKPDDAGSRWLLNIAYMTLGQYPQSVPAKYLIDPKIFASEYDMPRFPNIASKLGLDVDDLAGGTIVDDFDNDGFLDVVASSSDLLGQLRFFKNNGDGTFTERTSEAGLVGITGGLNIQQTDYNNDGFLDIFVLRGGWFRKGGRQPRSLLRNNGNGTFTDVTEEAGLLTSHPTQTCEWFDFDGDGWLDLFIGNESTDPNDPDPSQLYHNNRNGTFTECSRECGLAVAEFVKGVTFGDFDNDGRPDIYLSCNDGLNNHLFHNDGPRDPKDPASLCKFTEVTHQAGVEGPHNSFPTCFLDYDNDGFEDILVFGYKLPNGVADVAADYLGLPNHGTRPKLYHNNGNGTFSDVTEAAHLNRVIHSMGMNYGDLDNDGWLDLYCGTGDPDFSTLIPNRMFRNAGGKYFQDVTTATGTGHLQKGHGVAFADIDNDGDQDVFIKMGGAFSADNAKSSLFLNPGSTNAWLNLKLVGVRANRAAIGARVKVTVKTPHGPRDIFRTVKHGASFGANPLRLEIGLGDATEIVSVDIRWPGSDTRQTVRDLKIKHAYQIREGADTATALDFKKVPLSAAMASLKP